MIAGKGFRLLITAFSIAPCSDAQLQCSGSGLCIQKKLECDGEINCPDESDEALPKCLSTAAIAGIAVGCGILLILIIVAIVIGIICYQRKKRARIIKRAVQSWHVCEYNTAVQSQPSSPDVIMRTRDTFEENEHQRQLEKIPSSYWEIRLSQVEITPITDI